MLFAADFASSGHGPWTMDYEPIIRNYWGGLVRIYYQNCLILDDKLLKI
jgi:hypothetical protein